MGEVLSVEVKAQDKVSERYIDEGGGSSSLKQRLAKCEDGTKYAYPGTHTKYLWCNYGHFVLMQCPYGTIFCPRINVCCFGGKQYSKVKAGEHGQPGRLVAALARMITRRERRLSKATAHPKHDINSHRKQNQLASKDDDLKGKNPDIGNGETFDKGTESEKEGKKTRGQKLSVTEPLGLSEIVRPVPQTGGKSLAQSKAEGKEALRMVSEVVTSTPGRDEVTSRPTPSATPSTVPYHPPAQYDRIHDNPIFNNPPSDQTGVLGNLPRGPSRDQHPDPPAIKTTHAPELPRPLHTTRPPLAIRTGTVIPTETSTQKIASGGDTSGVGTRQSDRQTENLEQIAETAGLVQRDEAQGDVTDRDVTVEDGFSLPQELQEYVYDYDHSYDSVPYLADDSASQPVIYSEAQLSGSMSPDGQPSEPSSLESSLTQSDSNNILESQMSPQASGTSQKQEDNSYILDTQLYADASRNSDKMADSYDIRESQPGQSQTSQKQDDTSGMLDPVIDSRESGSNHKQDGNDQIRVSDPEHSLDRLTTQQEGSEQDSGERDEDVRTEQNSVTLSDLTVENLDITASGVTQAAYQGIPAIPETNPEETSSNIGKSGFGIEGEHDDSTDIDPTDTYPPEADNGVSYDYFPSTVSESDDAMVPVATNEKSQHFRMPPVSGKDKTGSDVMSTLSANDILSEDYVMSPDSTNEKLSDYVMAPKPPNGKSLNDIIPPKPANEKSPDYIMPPIPDLMSEPLFPENPNPGMLPPPPVTAHGPKRLPSVIKPMDALHMLKTMHPGMHSYRAMHSGMPSHMGLPKPAPTPLGRDGYSEESEAGDTNDRSRITGKELPEPVMSPGARAILEAQSPPFPPLLGGYDATGGMFPSPLMSYMQETVPDSVNTFRHVSDQRRHWSPEVDKQDEVTENDNGHVLKENVGVDSGLLKEVNPEETDTLDDDTFDDRIASIEEEDKASRRYELHNNRGLFTKTVSVKQRGFSPGVPPGVKSDRGQTVVRAVASRPQVVNRGDGRINIFVKARNAAGDNTVENDRGTSAQPKRRRRLNINIIFSKK